MSAKITPANVVQFLLSSCMVRLGIEGQLVNRDGMAMSDEEISLRLLEYGGIHISHPEHMALIREAARVVHDLKMLRWKEMFIRGEVDEAPPCPLVFKRSFGWNSHQKLKRLGWYQHDLSSSLRGVRFEAYKPEREDSLKHSRLLRRLWRKFLNVRQK